MTSAPAPKMTAVKRAPTIPFTLPPYLAADAAVAAERVIVQVVFGHVNPVQRESVQRNAQIR